MICEFALKYELTPCTSWKLILQEMTRYHRFVKSIYVLSEVYITLVHLPNLNFSSFNHFFNTANDSMST